MPIRVSKIFEEVDRIANKYYISVNIARIIYMRIVMKRVTGYPVSDKTMIIRAPWSLPVGSQEYTTI